MNKSLQIERLGLNPGDKIIVPKSGFNLIQHYAIYIGYDIDGNYYVAENVIGQGVILTTVNNFFTKNPRVTRIEKCFLDYYQRKKLIESVLSKLGKPYSLFNYNCEHFVNDVIKENPESKQLSNALGIACVFLLIGLIINY